MASVTGRKNILPIDLTKEMVGYQIYCFAIIFDLFTRREPFYPSPLILISALQIIKTKGHQEFLQRR